MAPTPNTSYQHLQQKCTQQRGPINQDHYPNTEYGPNCMRIIRTKLPNENDLVSSAGVEDNLSIEVLIMIIVLIVVLGVFGGGEVFEEEEGS